MIGIFKAIKIHLSDSGTSTPIDNLKPYFLVRLFFTTLFIIGPVLALTLYLQKISSGLVTGNLVQDTILTSAASDGMWKFILLAIITGPLFEELAYRLFLTKNYLLQIVGLSFFISLHTKLILAILKVDFPYINYLFYVLVLTIIPILFLFQKYIRDFFHKNFKIVFWASLIIFPIVHITNYTVSNKFVYLYMIAFTLPQLAVGSVLSFVRMQYGILYSFGFHTLYNLAMLMPAIVISLVDPSLLEAAQNTANPQSGWYLLSGFYILFMATISATFGGYSAIEYFAEK